MRMSDDPSQSNHSPLTKRPLLQARFEAALKFMDQLAMFGTFLSSTAERLP